MKVSTFLLAGTAIVGLTLAGAQKPAMAGVDFTGVCPNVVGAGPFGGGGVGSAAGCTIGITLQSASPNVVVNTAGSPGTTTGLVTSLAGPPTSYESIDDVLVGIVNTTSKTVSSVTITGSGIYKFEADGIDVYAGILPNAKDTTNYGGPLGFFTGITPSRSSGVVNFIGGLAPGASTFFSFELPPVGGLCTIPSQCHIGAPEPTSVSLLGTALAALAGIAGLISFRRRHQV